MEHIELQNIWKSYDQKMDSILVINKELAIELTRQKLNKQISKLYKPKWTAVLIGVPYTIVLVAITAIAVTAEAYLVALGFGAIALVMIGVLFSYFYQLYLISQVKKSDDVLSTQEHLSKLSISSFRCLNLVVFQLPFWSVCWVSIDAVKDSPFVYGGINLLIFLLLGYASFWLYYKLSFQHKNSKVRDFFLSGREWEPLEKSAELLEQIREYRD
ncbi:MAG: hypothetical protein AB8B53_09430 [Flavobacteriales bacterium]